MLLECDGNLANSCNVIEKKQIFWKIFFTNFHFLPGVRKTNYSDTNNNSPEIVQ